VDLLPVTVEAIVTAVAASGAPPATQKRTATGGSPTPTKQYNGGSTCDTLAWGNLTVAVVKSHQHGIVADHHRSTPAPAQDDRVRAQLPRHRAGGQKLLAKDASGEVAKALLAAATQMEAELAGRFHEEYDVMVQALQPVWMLRGPALSDDQWATLLRHVPETPLRQNPPPPGAGAGAWIDCRLWFEGNCFPCCKFHVTAASRRPIRAPDS
jgi:hypothetical protein